MKNATKIAYDYMLKNGYTCVLCNGEEVISSNNRGVKPLLEWQESGKDFSGFSAADKVVGKAAAYIYVLLKVKEVYAEVISNEALSVFEKHSISCHYNEVVPLIKKQR